MVAAASSIRIEGDGLEQLEVERFDVVEHLSTPTRIEAQCTAPADIPVAELIGTEVTALVVYGPTDEERFFHGVIMAATKHFHHVEELCGLTLEVGARMSPLRLGRDHRIYQELSSVEIVQDALERGGVPADATDWQVVGGYPPRDYVVQYGESDLDFVHRTLAEEGIGYAVSNDAAGALVMFFDDATQIQPITGDSAVSFSPDDPTLTTDGFEHVYAVREVRRGLSDATMSRDYDLSRPATDLSHEAEAEDSDGREVYLHPTRTTDDGLLEQRTQRLLERLRLRARTIEGRSTCRRFEAGRYFELTGHPRVDFGGEYLLLRVEHEELGESYHNRFVAIPKDTPYRPEATPPRPRLGGTEVGFVSGPSGAELHGSERGQVKVRLPWDRSGITDDKSSTWLRVGQVPMPGPMIVPRVGFEVIVDHELGDLDRPFVRGHLYNGEAPVPYALPGGATRTSFQTATTGGAGGVNELRFEDSGGSEEIFLNASKDMTVSIENNSAVDVVADEAVTIGGNNTVTTGGAHNEVVTGSRALVVGGNVSLNTAANYTDSVGGSLSFDCASRSVTAGGDYTDNVTGSLDRTVGGLQCVTGIAGYSRSVVGGSTTKVGAAMAMMSAASISSTAGAVRTETVGALKMVKAKSVSVSCGAAYVMNAASESIKCGADKTDSAMGAVAITAGGGMSVKATNINISGESKVVLNIGGTKIEVLPSSVTIKSGNIKMTTVKKLGSGPGHDTN